MIESQLRLIEHDIIAHEMTLYYLCGVMADGSISYVDGGHSDPQRVAMTQELYEHIHVYRDKQPERWVMVTISPVPKATTKTKKNINRKAVNQLNKMVSP